MGKHYDGELVDSQDPVGDSVDRLFDDFEDPFDRHNASRDRFGYADIGHAMTNVFVEHARYDPHQSGHCFMYTTCLLIVSVTANVIALAKWLVP